MSDCTCGQASDGDPLEPFNGAGPTTENEQDLLAEEFGEPNEDGIYGAVIEE